MDNSTTLSHLHAYCERAGSPDFWAEPVNAITNIFFILLALMAAKRGVAHSLSIRALDIWLLIFLMFSIGVGSGLWHTHANHWSLLTDVIPILLFINLYLFSLFRRLIQWPWWAVILVWVVFQGLNILSEMLVPRGALNGSIMYVPTLIVLLFSVFCVWRLDHNRGRELLTNAGVFFVSLSFRIIDSVNCESLPLGTHFIWHTLNAWVLYRLVCLLMASTGEAKTKEPHS